MNFYLKNVTSGPNILDCNAKFMKVLPIKIKGEFRSSNQSWLKQLIKDYVQCCVLRRGVLKFKEN